MLRRLRAELDADTLEIVTLLVSELVSNAVRHARAASVGFQVLVRPNCVRVDVTDHGPGFANPGGRHPPSPGSEGGFGLYLVDELATRWGVHDQDGTRVWFEIER